MVFALPVRKAIAKVEEHGNAVLDQLAKQHPGKPLHEIPYAAILTTTHRVLLNHLDWEAHGDEGGVRTKQRLYAHYEIGHFLMIERLVSQLKSEKLLGIEHEALFKQALGKLFYNPPLSLRVKQEKAFDKLVKTLGEEKTEELIRRATKLITDHCRDLDATGGKLPGHKLGADMFTNPVKQHHVLGWIPNDSVKGFKERLIEMKSIATKYGSAYKTR